jgi:hypothetical protein
MRRPFRLYIDLKHVRPARFAFSGWRGKWSGGRRPSVGQMPKRRKAGPSFSTFPLFQTGVRPLSGFEMAPTNFGGQSADSSCDVAQCGSDSRSDWIIAASLFAPGPCGKAYICRSQNTIPHRSHARPGPVCGGDGGGPLWSVHQSAFKRGVSPGWSIKGGKDGDGIARGIL